MKKIQAAIDWLKRHEKELLAMLVAATLAMLIIDVVVAVEDMEYEKALTKIPTYGQN